MGNSTISELGLLSLVGLLADEKSLNHSVQNGRIPFEQFKAALIRHQVIVELVPVLSKLKGLYSESEYKEVSALVEREAMKQLRMTREMLTVLALFKNEGIKIIPFKGPALSYELYGEYVRKTSSDLDFLVLPQQFMEAQRILIEKGYTSEKHDLIGFNRVYWAFFKRFNYHGSYFHRSEKVLTELHWKFFATGDAFPKTTESLFQDALNQQKKDQRQLRLPKEDLIVYLAMHGTVHLWVRLKWVIDIRGFMLRYGESTDWDLVREACESSKLFRAVSLAIRLSHDFFGTSVPAQFEWDDQDKCLNELWQLSLDSIQGEFRPASRNQYNQVMRLIKASPLSNVSYTLQDYGHGLRRLLSRSGK